jgi:hypothetical protein
MFEKIGRLAEAAATNVSVSRRGFFGRLGQAALAVGAVLGGFSTAAAGPRGVVCCYYYCTGHYPKASFRTQCQPAGTSCASYIHGTSCSLLINGQSTAAACKDCSFR